MIMAVMTKPVTMVALMTMGVTMAVMTVAETTEEMIVATRRIR